MKKQMFEELLGSVREGGAILRGRKKPSRRIEIRASTVEVIGESTEPFAGGFADLVGVDERARSGPE